MDARRSVLFCLLLPIQQIQQRYWTHKQIACEYYALQNFHDSESPYFEIPEVSSEGAVLRVYDIYSRMVSSLFRVVDHTVECQHVREYPRATLSGDDEILHLAVKQYIPKDNPNPQPGDVTILGAHANGFPKA